MGLVEAAIGAATAIADVKPEAVMFVGTAGLYPDRRPDLALAGVVAARRLVLMADGVASRDAYLPPALPATQESTMALRRIAVAAGLLMADVACPLAITLRRRPSGGAPDPRPATSRASRPSRSPVPRRQPVCRLRLSWASAMRWARPRTRRGNATRPALQPLPAAQPSR